MKSLLKLFVVIFLVQQTGYGQDQDFQSWAGFSVQKKIDKKLSFKYKNQARFDHNGSNFRVLINQFEGRYKVTKWMRLGLRFRFATSPTVDYKRYTGTVLFDKKVSEIKVNLRLQIQDKIESLGLHTIEHEASELNARSRLSADYSLNKKLSFSVSTEPIWELGADPFLSKFRSGLGGSYEMSKKINFDLQYYLQNNQAPLGEIPSTDYILVVGIDYDL